MISDRRKEKIIVNKRCVDMYTFEKRKSNNGILVEVI